MSKGFATALPPSKNTATTTASAADAQEVQSKWLSYFEKLEDPRGTKGKLHPFLTVVMIAILATIGGAKGWEDIELYGEGQAQWLGTFLELPWGIPKADCYRRLFARIEPHALQQCFQDWVTEIARNTLWTNYLH